MLARRYRPLTYSAPFVFPSRPLHLSFPFLRFGYSALRALAVAAALGLLLAGCARKAQAPVASAVVYPYSSETPRVFYATAQGLSEEKPQAFGAAAGSAGESAGGITATRAPNASILSSDGKAILVAINGWGIARLETNAGGRLETNAGIARQGTAAGGDYRLVATSLGSTFAGLTAAGAWPMKGGILVQLFRDPFSEPEAPSSHLSPAAPIPASRLAFFDAEGALASAPEPFSAFLREGYELFALLPAGGAWFAELRKESPERVELKFFSLNDPLAADSGLREIRKSDFEAALKPRSLASLGGELGDALKAAVAALGKGSWIVRLRDSKGGDDWYLSSGAAEDARAVYAWAEGPRALALRFDGWLAVADGGKVQDKGPAKAALSRLEPPTEGAVFTALAAAGDTLAAAWESGEFPNIEAAGLVVGRIASRPGRATMKP